MHAPHFFQWPVRLTVNDPLPEVVELVSSAASLVGIAAQPAPSAAMGSLLPALEFFHCILSLFHRLLWVLRFTADVVREQVADCGHSLGHIIVLVCSLFDVVEESEILARLRRVEGQSQRHCNFFVAHRFFRMLSFSLVAHLMFYECF